MVVLPYAAPFTYAPRGTDEVALKAKQRVSAIKRGDRDVIDRAAAWLQRQGPGSSVCSALGPSATLIPVPGSGMRTPGGLWVPERICEALLAARLGGSIWRALERKTPVAKAAFAAAGERPTLQTLIDSLEVADWLPPTGQLVLVDDVVTKGRTLLSCATVLLREFREVEVSAFALFRTQGFVTTLGKMVSPVTGSIREESGDAVRDP